MSRGRFGLCLRLCLLAAALLPPLAAFADASPEQSGAEDWQTVTLFDWLYSGEKPYQALAQAAAQAGDQGWVARRLASGQKVPQASARELAQKLWDSPLVDAGLRARLKTLFADEPEQLGQGSQDAVAKAASGLDDQLAADSAKMDALEAAMAKNNIGKGTSPGVTLNLFSAYRVDDPAGMVQGQEHTYPAGGMQALLAGTMGKVTYNFEVSAVYYYNELNQGGAGASQTDLAASPEALAVDPKTDLGYVDSGLDFEFPLGRFGGLDVSLGSIQNVELSPLLFAGIEPINRDTFFVDVLNPYQATNVVKSMEMNYPSATYNFRGLYVVMGSPGWWWPFNSQIIYTPSDQTYYYDWDAKLETWAIREDYNLNPRGHWFDGGLVYGMVQGSSNDSEQLYADGTLPSVPPNDPLVGQQSTFSYGLGSQLHLSSGANVHLDAAASSYSWEWPVPTGGDPSDYTQAYNGTAVIATVTQPLGPFNFALQAGSASPYFLSSPRVENRIQVGATQDSIAQPYGPDGVGLDSAETSNSGGAQKPPAVSWLSMMNDPDVLTNNNNQLALKGEWHSSWISAGAYDGAQMQINPTDAYVWTTPYIEGNEDDGYGWFRMFGNAFASGPAVEPDAPLPAGTGSGTMDQILFNRPTDGHALYNNGGVPTSMPVHWQQMAQYGNYETEFITLLSQNGAGNNTVLADSAKSLNYAGANLLFDLGALMDRTLPLQLTVIGEDRDLSTMPGLPDGGGSSSLFNQEFQVADLNWGVTDTITLLGTAGFETWKTVQSDYPVNMQITEFGVGSDLDESALITGLATGLVFNFRASVMNYEDLNIAARDLSLITLSLGCTLSY